MELDHTFSFGRARASDPLAVARHGFNAVPLHDSVIEEQIVLRLVLYDQLVL